MKTNVPGLRWLDPEWHTATGYQFARTHDTSEAFRERQQQRMAAAQRSATNVKPLRRKAP